MIYYKKANGDVYAYHKTDIEKVDALNDLEIRLHNRESELLIAQSSSITAFELMNKLELFYLKMSTAEYAESEIEEIRIQFESAKAEYDLKLNELNSVEVEYQQTKSEYDAILPIFFDIRDNLQTLKKMTRKEIEIHTNPPIAKEQLVTQAEQEKQSLLSEANESIAPLQYAVDLGMATDEEMARLEEWKKYSVILNRVDTSLAPDIEWPQKPE